MKLTCFILLLLIQGIASFAQKTQKFYDYQWKETDAAHARFYSVMEHTDSGYHRLDYYVHDMTLQMDGWFEDSACKIHTGNLILAYPGKKLEAQGRYIHNKRQGLCFSFYPNGMMADSTVYDNGKPIGISMKWHSNGIQSDSAIYHPDGSGVEVSWFDNGNPSSAGILAPGFKKQGKWQYFHKNGRLSALEIYDNGRLVEKHYFDETGQPLSDTTNKDSEASFNGGTKAWLKYLGNHLYFPENYKITNSDEAAVVITMTVDEDGQVKDAYVSTPFYPPFEEIALKVITHSPKWKPAIKHNRRVSTVFRQPVVFSQPD